MARGRMLSASISESHQVASLPDDTARLIFTWLIPHADAVGRYSAHPMVIAGKVLTLLGIDNEVIIQALVAMHVVGLVRLYEAEGQPYLVFLGWERHQTIRHDREKPKYPSPSPSSVFPAAYISYLPEYLREDAGTMPGVLPADDRVSSKEVQKEAQVQEEVQAQTQGDDDVGASRPARDYEFLMEVYNNSSDGLPKVLQLNQKRRDGLDNLIKEHGFDGAAELLADATKFVAADEFWGVRKYNLDNLLAEPGRVLEKAEKYRATHSASKKSTQYEEMGL